MKKTVILIFCLCGAVSSFSKQKSVENEDGALKGFRVIGQMLEISELEKMVVADLSAKTFSFKGKKFKGTVGTTVNPKGRPCEFMVSPSAGALMLATLVMWDGPKGAPQMLSARFAPSEMPVKVLGAGLRGAYAMDEKDKIVPSGFMSWVTHSAEQQESVTLRVEENIEKKAMTVFLSVDTQAKEEVIDPIVGKLGTFMKATTVFGPQFVCTWKIEDLVAE